MLLDPANIQHVYVSPRQRSQKTYDLLFAGVEDSKKPPRSTEEGVREWTYGDYEGKTSGDIKKERGKSWDIVSSSGPGTTRS